MKIRIGYFPISADLSHPADRRRLVYWATQRGHIIKPFETANVDVVVLAGRSNFSACIKKTKSVTPIVLDLVDSYVADQTSFSDLMRGVTKVLIRKQNSLPKRYSSILNDAVARSRAIICENYEQATLYTARNPKVFAILDFHEEFPFLPIRDKRQARQLRILWEGQPYTLRGWSQIAKSLNSNERLKANVKLVTSPSFFRYFDSFLQVPTSGYARRIFGNLPHEIIDWSVENLIGEAREANVSLIPVARERMAQFKAENRLLIMWRLGVPTLVDQNYAHNRIQELFDFRFVKEPEKTWEMFIKDSCQDPSQLLDQVSQGQDYIRETHSRSQLLKKWDEVFASVL